ncbi:hypothetical protein DSO57_1039464 [Entomophthora muscae]|uniref:Uncharacterized protein n=1 Tax=Entomophthora muscae TaxID=34485 RepID=A0ACC2SYM8_9FUNG|nr:hypothetical protein DSO57_1039464 [Entomophthora muscae]
MDYRKVHELGIVFDKIISIEMLEAVGGIQTYLETCSNVLKRDGGIMVFSVPRRAPSDHHRPRKCHQPGLQGLTIINEVTNIGAHYIRALRL